jgi:hypothetical protein
MKVALDTFSRSGIEARLGGDMAAGVQAALRHYTQRLGSGRKLPEFPRFRRESPLRRSGADLELAVDPEILEALEQKARESRGVSVEQLAAHAVLVYLADLDKEASGLSTRRLTRF